MEPQPTRAGRRAGVVRRRRLAAFAVAGAAFAAGATVGATTSDGPSGARPQQPSRAAAGQAGAAAAARSREPLEAPRAARPREPLDAPGSAPPRVPLERQVGTLIVLRFEGPSVPAYVRRALRAGHAAGAILFRDNVRDPAQVRALTRTLRRAGGPGTLVAVDQEGGPVRILPWAPPDRAAPAQGVARSAGTDARAGAEALRRAGVNVSLAPVADVPARPGAAMAGRALATTPTAVAAAVVAAVRGWRAGGVAPAVKHFPGLGGAAANTDERAVAIRRSRAALDGDLVPFAAAIRAGVPLVMVGHARYPALDRDHIASQSRAIVTDLLRGQLRFRGVAITDSLEAAAVRAARRGGGVAQAAEASLRAGADVLLTTGQGSAIHVYRRLLSAARRDRALRARVRQSAARVRRLRRRLTHPAGL